MTDLISRADAIEALCCDCAGEHYPNCSCMDTEIIAKLPSADAVHGEWVDMEIPCNPYPPVFCVECSRCGYRVGRETFLENTFNFCPNCGAIMKGGAE